MRKYKRENCLFLSRKKLKIISWQHDILAPASVSSFNKLPSRPWNTFTFQLLRTRDFRKSRMIFVILDHNTAKNWSKDFLTKFAIFSQLFCLFKQGLQIDNLTEIFSNHFLNSNQAYFSTVNWSFMNVFIMYINRKSDLFWIGLKLIFFCKDGIEINLTMLPIYNELSLSLICLNQINWLTTFCCGNRFFIFHTRFSIKCEKIVFEMFWSVNVYVLFVLKSKFLQRRFSFLKMRYNLSYFYRHVANSISVDNIFHL